MQLPTQLLSGGYDYRLVALSIVISVCASYAALDLAGRLTVVRGRALLAWLSGGALAMGLGIWSTHYIGMLALRMSVPVSYDWPTVMFSLRVAVIASGVALYIVSRKRTSIARAAAGSVFMGGGIAAMHYIGMEAMRSTADRHYERLEVALSVAAGMLISFVAFQLAYRGHDEQKGFSSKKVLSAAILGLAVPATHYTAMAAVRFTISDALPDMSHAISITTLGAAGITIVTLMILALAILTSVLDRRLAAQTHELQTAEKRYRLLFERSLSGILRTTIDGRTLDCNLACAKCFGYETREEFIESRIIDRYFSPEQRLAFISALQKTKSLNNFEECLRRKDGSKLWILGSATLVEGDHGAQTMIEKTFVDITQRRNAEEKFQKAFNANPEPITIATVSEGRFVDVNESFLQVTGYNRDEVIGRTSNELQFWERPDDRTKFIELLKRDHSIRELEIRYRTKEGKLRTAVDSAEFVEVGGQECIIAIFRDITEQQTLEKQLRQTQKMEAVGKLTGGIAHDFNNLLGVIIGYSEILEHRLAPESQLVKECQQITKAAQSAASLTRQLLAFSRQQILEPKVVDVNAIILNVEKMLRRLIGEDIELKTNLDPALGSVKADQTQIEQVILNLAVNARDAMPHGGKILIETANIDLDEEYARRHPPQQPGPHVMLIVADTGTGIDAETQAHIFEPFFTTKDVGKGTGLGLSTVYGVVRQSGGHIWVYSEVGHGTTFKIYLPRAGQLPNSKQLPVAGNTSLGHSETILLVEDETALRGLAKTLLEDSGYTVLEASQPVLAIEVAKKHPGTIHLLLSDMVMPGMNGRDLAAKLIKMRPDMKTVFMSGYTRFTHAGLAGQEISLLSKPFTRDALLRKVREVLDTETVHSR